MSIQTLLPSPWQRFCDNNGNPAVGYLVYTYQSGTTTPAVTYTDFTGTQKNLNPIVLDFRGECSIWGPPNTAYTYVFTFPNDTNPPSNPIKTVNGIQNGLSLTQGVIGSALYPQTQAELNAGITPVNYGYPPMNVLRYGFVPNQSGAPYIGSNTIYATQLFQPTVTNGPTGKFYFPNTTGNDIYYFNDLVALRDYTHIDLNSCTWSLVKGASTGNEASAGALIGVRGITIENGTVSVNYTVSETACITFGARESDAGGGSFFPNSYDASMSVPQGYCTARNLTLTSNSPQGYGMTLTGGMRNVTIEDIEIQGNNALAGGIYYEYGFATNGGGVTSSRLSSHMYNCSIKNVDMENITQGEAVGITMAGAYNFDVKNIYLNGGATVFAHQPGEAMYYQPWTQDLTGKKLTKRLENITGENLTSHGVILQGTSVASGGYLGNGIAPVVVGNPPLTQAALWAAEKNLALCSLDGFALSGTVNGTGVLTSCQAVDVRNGACSGFNHGFGAYDESEQIILENFTASGSVASGIALDLGNNNSDSPNWSGTATISGTVMTVTATASGSLVNGGPIVAPGIVTAGTVITSFGTYTTGAGTGTVNISPSQTVSNATTLYSCYQLKQFTISNCKIIGNSTGSAGASPGIGIANCLGGTIENCTLNSPTETTQGNSIQLELNTQNVICRNNQVGAMVGSSNAYANVVNPGGSMVGATNGNTVINPSGTITQKGAWANLLSLISPDRGTGSVTLTGGADYTTQFINTANSGNITYTLANNWVGRIIRQTAGAGTIIINPGAIYTFAANTTGTVDIGLSSAGVLMVTNEGSI